MVAVGRITQIWRFPVKSMAGERLPAVDVGTLGMHADRTWAVRDVKLGATTGAKRLPTLLQCTARYAAPPPPEAGPGHAPEVIVGFPDGTEISSSDPKVHDALSSYLGRDVELRPLPALSDKAQYRGPLMTKTDIRTIMGLGPDEPLPDMSMFPVSKLAELTRYATPVGTYYDAYPLHLLTEQSLRTMSTLAPESNFDLRRFRPGVLVETSEPGDDYPEWDWCGGMLHAPGADLKPLFPTIRCSMPTREQGDLPEDREVVRTISAHANRCLGVYIDLPRAGRIAEGDVLTLDRGRVPLGARPDAVVSKVKRVVMKAGTAAMPKGKAR